MPAYLIGRIEVTDPEKYKTYIAATPGILEKFGGKFIVRGGEKATLEGPEETARVVLVEFPSLQSIKDFYNSPEYQEARKLREGAATAHLVALEGV
jgi:uncharacterized protein (DUF1330 family)